MTLLLALLLQSVVQSPQEAFARAETFYESQEYEQAAEVYEALLEAGVEDAAVHYNLGNARFKSGSIGLAILAYERASRLDPTDEDIRTNLAFANEQVADAVDETPMPAAVRFGLAHYERVAPGTLAVLLSAVALLGGLGVTSLLLDRPASARGAAVALVTACIAGAVLLGGLLATKVLVEADRVEAVVLTDNAYVRSGPGEANPRLAEIHEGLKVRVLAERDEWYQVSLRGGLTGWLRRSEIEEI